ncbi:uncharacterized protein LOC114579354 [Dendrobium catenatum]|uniref:uncharacterized protein LOC114579354 n=1 Tax=Dendrobium catenatum TaxID=906689 RepID=UPI0010A0346C|nr:uncharacterized protein LOC114579354 [Dendrobium catenatum]
MSDLSSVGHYYTRHNQRIDNPIHIKLDRVFVNDNWMSSFPNSYYIVSDPDISDHCPIILNLDSITNNSKRFMFKNYWSKLPAFWNEVLKVFSLPTSGSLIFYHYHKLRELKFILKQRNWNSSNSLREDFHNLSLAQTEVFSKLQQYPLNHTLNTNLKSINSMLCDLKARLLDWATQRSKTKWLKAGEDDLKFLYANINIRHNSNQIRGVLVDGTLYTSQSDVNFVFINHFQRLFNATPPSGSNPPPNWKLSAGCFA